MMAKIRTLNLGEYVRHPSIRDRIMQIEDGAGSMSVFVRNRKDANDFIFLNGEQEVEVVTIGANAE